MNFLGKIIPTGVYGITLESGSDRLWGLVCLPRILFHCAACSALHNEEVNAGKQ
jgi:hypothetical protein